jgi:two-component system OmpR family response regulator
MMTKSISQVLKIVTVEDSLIIVDRIAEMISDVPDVEFLGNARTIVAAVTLIADCKPHVVILDINLGDVDGKSGIDLLMIVRKMDPVMKIIMFTNLTGNHYRILCSEYGADYFFDKSNEFDKLLETLNQILVAKRLVC